MVVMTKASCKTRKKSVNQHYESQWEVYSEKDVLKRVENLGNVIDSIISQLNLKHSATILDLGSGPGIIPLRMAQGLGDDPDTKIYGLDISEKAIKLGNRVIAKSGLSNSIHLLLADAENLPFQDRSFDAVVSNATLNLLVDKEMGLDEMARVTKDGGKVVIADCTAKENKTRCQNTIKNDRLWSVCVAGAPTKAEIEKFAGQVGLEVLKTSDLTNEVSYLVRNRLWDWPEFIEYELEYHIFVMRKVG